MRRDALVLTRAVLACALWVAAGGCGTDRALTGVWQQVCEGDEAGCTDASFVYKLHLGRFGDDLTGLVVRYVNPDGDATFDPKRECGCYLVTSGSASGLTTRFEIEPGVPSALGCPSTSYAFAAAGCRDALRVPPCQAVQFELDGETDTLVGTLACDDRPPAAVRFEPVNERLRRTCVGDCRNAPDAEPNE